jgi:hypothetical protein
MLVHRKINIDSSGTVRWFLSVRYLAVTEIEVTVFGILPRQRDRAKDRATEQQNKPVTPVKPIVM